LEEETVVIPVLRACRDRFIGVVFVLLAASAVQAADPHEAIKNKPGN